jgi:hypothetical protein
LRGERFDFLGDHREAAAGLAGARRFDGGVERQEVRLFGNVGDELDDVADATGRACKLRDARVGLFRLRDRLQRNPRRFLHLPANFADRTDEALGGARHRSDVFGSLCRGEEHLTRQIARGRRRGFERFRRSFKFGR